MVGEKTTRIKVYSNDIVETLGTLKTPVRCNDSKIQKAKITVIADVFRPILGRDLFDKLVITISISIYTVMRPALVTSTS